MACNIGDTYVGLTDDPERRKEEHRNPADFRVERNFGMESEARAWERRESSRLAHCGGSGGAGWRVGYKYTVTRTTEQ